MLAFHRARFAGAIYFFQVAAREAAENARREADAARDAAEKALEETQQRFKEAEEYLEEKKNAIGHGQMWWIERELHEAKKYMPLSKGGIARK